jgi:hypothetical protein
MGGRIGTFGEGVMSGGVDSAVYRTARRVPFRGVSSACSWHWGAHRLDPRGRLRAGRDVLFPGEVGIARSMAEGL